MTRADLTLVADMVEWRARDNARSTESVKLGSDGLDFLEAFVASVHSICENLQGRHAVSEYMVSRALTGAEASHVAVAVLSRYDLSCLNT